MTMNCERPVAVPWYSWASQPWAFRSPGGPVLAFHPHFTWLPGVLQGRDLVGSGSDMHHLGLF